MAATKRVEQTNTENGQLRRAIAAILFKFTAAQAAQKASHVIAYDAVTFTAAQAAQKVEAKAFDG